MVGSKQPLYNLTKLLVNVGLFLQAPLEIFSSGRRVFTKAFLHIFNQEAFHMFVLSHSLAF
jgi:hypothetical protein